mmetsp:Transcript_16715/g.36274  ORF Transcript_16715/g.36274 Transcript_16715/m.36274 type:complete len:95 (+) Transcript_16715:2251-2535(+)
MSFIWCRWRIRRTKRLGLGEAAIYSRVCFAGANNFVPISLTKINSRDVENEQAMYRKTLQRPARTPRLDGNKPPRENSVALLLLSFPIGVSDYV